MGLRDHLGGWDPTQANCVRWSPGMMEAQPPGLATGNSSRNWKQLPEVMRALHYGSDLSQDEYPQPGCTWLG